MLRKVFLQGYIGCLISNSILIMHKGEHDNPYTDAREYYNTRSAQFVKDYLYGNQRVVAAIKFAIGQIGHRSPTHRLLDIGCGLGWTTFEVARHFPNAEAQGIDMSDKLIDLAQRLFHLPNLTYNKVDVLGPDVLPCMEEKYDAILLIDVYEHIPEALRPVFFDRMNSMLSESGIIIMTIPSPEHQTHLYAKQPDDLQPVDEVVTLRDVLIFADNMGSKLHHYSHQNIWSTHDYVHIALTRAQATEISYQRSVRVRTEMPLKRMISVWRYAFEYAPPVTEMVIRLHQKITKRPPFK